MSGAKNDATSTLVPVPRLIMDWFPLRVRVFDASDDPTVRFPPIVVSPEIEELAHDTVPVISTSPFN